jgi:hypothetical protein
MLSFDKKKGFPVCKIIGGKLNNQIIYCNSENMTEDKTHFNSIKLNDAVFQQYPNINLERQIYYITGPSGSGKSTYIAKNCKEWKKRFPGRKIYLFSHKKEDETLDNLGVKRIMLDQSLVSDPLDLENFSESMVIFDDVDVIPDKKIRAAVFDIMNEILEVGRSLKIYAWISYHLPTAGKDTKRILNECNTVTYFPFASTGRIINYLLTEYLSLTPNIIKGIKQTKSRWATIYKNYPPMIMTEKTLNMNFE